MKYSPIQAAPTTISELFYWIFNELLQLVGLFERIPEEAVAAAYGMLRISALTSLPNAGLVAQPIQPWTSAGDLDFVDADLARGELTVRSDGTYFLYVNLSIGVDSNRVYSVVVYLNGIATGSVLQIDSTNQTAALYISFSGTAKLKNGDVLRVYYGCTTANSNFDAYTGSFGITRISGVR